MFRRIWAFFRFSLSALLAALKQITVDTQFLWLVALLAAALDLALAIYAAPLRQWAKMRIASLLPTASVPVQRLVHAGITNISTDFLVATVTAILQVAITLLGLYFAAITVVASSSYRGVYVSVRSLLVEQTRSKRLLAAMVFLASYSALALLALSFGVPLGFCTGLVLIVFSLWLFATFLKTGLELLEYLDPQRALAQQPALIAAEVVRGPATWTTDLRPKLALLPGLVEVARQAGDTAAITSTLSASLQVFVRFRQTLETNLDQRAYETAVDDREFHGQRRSNETHASTTDPEAKLARKGQGKEAKLSYSGNLLIENRNGLIVNAMAWEAIGTAERDTALLMLEQVPGDRRVTVGGDKGFRHAGVRPGMPPHERDTARSPKSRQTRRQRHR